MSTVGWNRRVDGHSLHKRSTVKTSPSLAFESPVTPTLTPWGRWMASFFSGMWNVVSFTLGRSPWGFHGSDVPTLLPQCKGSLSSFLLGYFPTQSHLSRYILKKGRQGVSPTWTNISLITLWEVGSSILYVYLPKKIGQTDGIDRPTSKYNWTE